jgi:hypothetical protein
VQTVVDVLHVLKQIQCSGELHVLKVFFLFFLSSWENWPSELGEGEKKAIIFGDGWWVFWSSSSSIIINHHHPLLLLLPLRLVSAAKVVVCLNKESPM